ncbi:c-type cytochrome [Nitrosococcus oceani]|nr:cytochrome c [Nitrosococcus oceani]KFI18665.1 cytochrome C [Nitrosococcus oceani C-27]KFI21926.1 cytochrome C [Nitrosococcus oceani]
MRAEAESTVATAALSSILARGRAILDTRSNHKHLENEMVASAKRITAKWSLVVGISSLACLLPPTAWAGADGSWKNGAEVYAKVCGYCHEGGIIGPVLKGRELPPAYIVQVVRNGLLAMPAFTAAFIDDKALREVADYLSKSAAESKEGGENGR